MTPDNQFTPLQRFWNLLGQYKKQVRLVYFYAFISGIVSLTIPLAIKPVISFLQSGEVSSSWIFLTMLVLSGVAFSGFIQVLQLRVVENIQQDIFVRSSFDFAFRLPKIKHIDLNNVHNPELVNRFFDFIFNIIFQETKGLIALHEPQVKLSIGLVLIHVLYDLPFLHHDLCLFQIQKQNSQTSLIECSFPPKNKQTQKSVLVRDLVFVDLV